ncbi:MAG: TolB family protein [Actinomycetota bacterium]
MRDLDLVFSTLDDLEAPVSWPDVERREPHRLPPGPGLGRRLLVAAVALAVAAAGIGLAFRALSVGGPSSVTPVTDHGIAPTPTNGALLYAKRLSDGWSLFALDPETGTERQITQGYRDYGSDWSPDGTRIVYDSESREGGQGIWVANADGSEATKLIDDGSVPAWSPDGTKIAFARADLGKMVPFGAGSAGTPFYLYVMDADGTNVQRLTDGRFSDYSPAWSPDGTQIAFVRYGREGAGLYVINADGSAVRQVAGPGVEIFGAPAWSSDGTSIAIAVNGAKNGPPGGILLLPADGTGEGTMIPGTEAEYPGYVSNPAWSPDGEWIAYLHGNQGELVILHPDGSDRRMMNVDPETDSIEELAWGAAPPTVSPSG